MSVTRKLVCAGLLLAMGFGFSAGATSEPSESSSEASLKEENQLDPNWNMVSSEVKYMVFKKEQVCQAEQNLEVVSDPFMASDDNPVLLFVRHKCEELDSKSTWLITPMMLGNMITKLPGFVFFNNITNESAFKLIEESPLWTGCRIGVDAQSGVYQFLIRDDKGELSIGYLEVMLANEDELRIRYKVLK